MTLRTCGRPVLITLDLDFALQAARATESALLILDPQVFAGLSPAEFAVKVLRAAPSSRVLLRVTLSRLTSAAVWTYATHPIEWLLSIRGIDDLGPIVASVKPTRAASATFILLNLLRDAVPQSSQVEVGTLVVACKQLVSVKFVASSLGVSEDTYRRRLASLRQERPNLPGHASANAAILALNLLHGRANYGIRRTEGAYIAGFANAKQCDDYLRAHFGMTAVQLTRASMHDALLERIHRWFTSAANRQ